MTHNGHQLETLCLYTVEWIDFMKRNNNETVRLSLPITFPKINATHYYRYGSQSKWKKFINMSSAMLLTYENSSS